MAETQLTKDIKAACRLFRPVMNSSMRTIRWADEVSVGAGRVDVIRFEDFVEGNNDFCVFEEYNEPCKHGGDPEYNQSKCKGCVHKRSSKELGILTTCYEVKITKSDFKSPNGHNFVGNYNYYAVPKKLVPQIIDLVPKNIGVITYNENGNMRVYKHSIFQELSDRDLSRFLYNAMKKWCDNPVERMSVNE